MRVVIITIILTVMSSAYAEVSLFDRATNMLRKIVGRNDRIIQVELPTIPKVNKDSTSIETAESYKDPNANRFSLKDKQKFDYYFIEEVYKATRHVKANSNDVAQWMNVIGQGGSREGVYRAVVLGRDYRAMESYTNVRLKNKNIIFIEEYLSKYLNKKIKDTSLKVINMYTVKRLVVEMSLEVVDSFLINGRPQDLFSWYGLMSAELAEKYPKVWKSKQRKNASAQGQMEWARAVPIQLVKSEVILKLHKIINFLNRS